MIWQAIVTIITFGCIGVFAYVVYLLIKYLRMKTKDK